jgi:hypothetical protein
VYRSSEVGVRGIRPVFGELVVLVLAEIVESGVGEKGLR